MKKIFLLLMILCYVFIAFCQVEYPFNSIKSNGYFDAYVALDTSRASYEESKYENEYWQAKGTLYAFLGKYNAADYCYYYRDSILDRIPEEFVALETDEKLSVMALDSLCNNYNIVLLNEAHYKSEHRAFLYHQLPLFYKKGFRYLALEALNNYEWRDSLLSERGYPLYTKTGIYINDPVYAHVIRRAIELGFQLIAYDHYGADREQNQAINILNQYNPEKGKLLVYGGYAHICESPERKLMGSYIKGQSGEEVLSLSQYIPMHYGYDDLKRDDIQIVASRDDCFDYFVIPSISTQVSNIPTWMALMDFKYQLLSDFYSSRLVLPSLIQLFNKNEENGVPVYQYLVEKKEKDISLVFPQEGEYSLVIIDKNRTDTIQIEFQ